MPAAKPTHPIFAAVKADFASATFGATEFRRQSTLIVQPSDLHKVMRWMYDHEAARFNMLSDIAGIDYLNYSAKMPGRFGIVYNLVSHERDDRFWVKTFLEPSLPTLGIDEDPALYLDSVTDIWPGAEWLEREVFDMFGVRFRGHPDLRRILTWESYPAHPLRKDYPLRGRGERESYRVIDRTSS